MQQPNFGGRRERRGDKSGGALWQQQQNRCVCWLKGVCHKCAFFFLFSFAMRYNVSVFVVDKLKAERAKGDSVLRRRYWLSCAAGYRSSEFRARQKDPVLGKTSRREPCKKIASRATTTGSLCGAGLQSKDYRRPLAPSGGGKMTHSPNSAKTGPTALYLQCMRRWRVSGSPAALQTSD